MRLPTPFQPYFQPCSNPMPKGVPTPFHPPVLPPPLYPLGLEAPCGGAHNLKLVIVLGTRRLRSALRMSLCGVFLYRFRIIPLGYCKAQVEQLHFYHKPIRAFSFLSLHVRMMANSLNHQLLLTFPIGSRRRFAHLF